MLGRIDWGLATEIATEFLIIVVVGLLVRAWTDSVLVAAIATLAMFAARDWLEETGCL